MRLIFSTAILLVVIGITACDKTNDFVAIDGKPIDDFLERSTINESPYLKIKTAGLSKDFLLYGNFIPMLNSPTGYSLKSRIVRFEIVGDRVIMLESAQGHSLAQNNESTILLAEFPLIQKDKDGVLIDFAKGMQVAYTTRNVHSRAVSESEPGTAEQFKTVVLSASFIRSIAIDANTVAISQVAQWRNQKSELTTAEFRYFLREYNPSAHFIKKPFGKNRWLQYFSTPPMVDKASTKTFAYTTLWETRDPITFYISANTPTPYRQAIKDGLIFWNHIFGKELIVVKDLEDGISAPHPRFNIVQWVPWDNESSAYADIVIDHLTGQILQAQIYVRSGWVAQSAKKLKNQLEELLTKDQEKGLAPIEEGVLMPVMLEQQESCTISLNADNSLPDVATLATAALSDETIITITGDILRTVIAHEMGHVLGLRHNLAGSLMGTIAQNTHDDLLRHYLNYGSIPLDLSAYLSSSIMDVFSVHDDALMGSQIRQILEQHNYESSPLTQIYGHDKLAIDVGYFDKSPTGQLPFCSDDDMAIYLDCRRWDYTDKPFLLSLVRLNNVMTQIALLLADTFAQALDNKRAGSPLTIDDIPLTNVLILKVVDQYAKDVFAWFNEKARSVQVEAKLPAYGPHNAQEITQARFLSMQEQLKSLGNINALFGLLPPYRSKQLDASMLAHQFSEQFKRRLNEQSISLSQADIDKATAKAEAFLKHLNQEIIYLMLNILNKTQFDDKNYQLPIEKALGAIAQEIIFSETTDKKSPPEFLYPLKTRDAAALLLSPALGVLPDWSYDSIENASSKLKQLIRKYHNPSEAMLNLDTTPRADRQWLLEQNRIFNTLMSIRNTARLFKQPEVK